MHPQAKLDDDNKNMVSCYPICTHHSALSFTATGQMQLFIADFLQ